MKTFLKNISQVFVPTRFYVGLGTCAFAFVLAYFVPVFSPVAIGLLTLLTAATALDVVILFRTKVDIRRELPERFSNADANDVILVVSNFSLQFEIYEELPFQFQKRDFCIRIGVEPLGAKRVVYALTPVERGEYDFGNSVAFVLTRIGLVKRRFVGAAPQTVAVYPSFVQMRKYELMAAGRVSADMGVKKKRKLGHTMEFENIRPYVLGDDYRSLNWKASARKSELMVNQYRDERSQPVYCLIDLGRPMQMPFGGMTLLDYAVNSALVMANMVLLKEDRFGLCTFSTEVSDFLPADRKPGTLNKVLETLYRQKTVFPESDFEALYTTLSQRIRNRSLLLMYTNFESLTSMRRNLPYLRKMARRHLLVVIFFQNAELEDLARRPADNVEKIYTRTMAEKLAMEKRQIVRELESYGIHALLCEHGKLSAQTLNRYLELKARGKI
jgi:uncharacterized protein (DUF58 family)